MTNWDLVYSHSHSPTRCPQLTDEKRRTHGSDALFPSLPANVMCPIRLGPLDFQKIRSLSDWLSLGGKKLSSEMAVNLLIKL